MKFRTKSHSEVPDLKRLLKIMERMDGLIEVAEEAADHLDNDSYADKVNKIFDLAKSIALGLERELKYAR